MNESIIESDTMNQNKIIKLEKMEIVNEQEQSIPIFNKKIFEISMNIINLTSISILCLDENIYLELYMFILQIFISMIFIIEFLVFLYILGN